MRNLFKYCIYLSVVVALVSCGGGSVGGSSNNNTGSNLIVNAPDQYPAGIATTAYLTILNNSQSTVSNLTYAVPDATNHTSTTVSVDADSAAACKSINAGASCVLKVQIGANSKPGSFSVVATSLSASSFVSKLKGVIGLNSQSFVLTTNIGLTNIPTNTQNGANGISFLYSPSVSLAASGSTMVSVVAVVNQNAGNNFNTIQLTTVTGEPLDFSVLSGNSGNGLTNLSPGSVVTFQLNIPAGASSPYSFYAKTLENNSVISQATTANPINVINATQGILSVQPTEFNLSAANSYTTQVITYSNIGNQAITGLNIQTPQVPISIEQNNCNVTLAVGKSCTIRVTSNAVSGATGSGSIIANYNGNNSVISNYSYSGSGSSQSGLSVSAVNNFIFAATTGNGSSSTKLTIKNIGSVDENNFVLSFVPNKYFSVSQEAGDTCSVNGGVITNTLSAGASCVATLSYTNSTLGAGLTTMNINYSYSGQTANLSQVIAWQTTSGGATLGVSPVSYNFGPIVANNSESKTQTFVITNQGPESIVVINFAALSGDAGYFSVESGGVGGCATGLPLANGSTCSFVVKFGPTSSINQLISAALPINYSFQSGSSSTNLTLSGYSRSSVSANVQLTNVVSSAPNGNGESANSAFQFESSAAMGTTVTLTYQNLGQTSATNFTITQAPSGYTIQSNGCNGVQLNANSGNSCNVVLHPTITTVGNLNIQLSSSVLYGSWSDENGTVSNQSILWSTVNGTQNMIYANIYQAPVVSAILSSESSGLTTITLANTDSTFYVVLSLTGGYNENTSYGITAPNGFNPTSANCVISSISPQCNVAITAPSTAISGAIISISGGSVTPTPVSLNLDVVNPPAPTTYAYMSTGSTGIFQCTVSESDGLLTNCAKKGNPNAAPGYIVSLAMYPNGNYLYALTNKGALPTDVGSYYACPLNNNGQYESASCSQKNFPAYGNLAFAPTQGDLYAYLAGQPDASNGNQPNYCTIIGESSLFCNTRSSYPTQTSRAITSALVNGSSYVYISSISDSKIFACDVTNSAGYNSPNCPNAAGVQSMNISSISTIQIGDIYYAYVNDNGTFDVCQIESSGINKGAFATCNPADPNSVSSGVTNVTRISTTTINGKPYLYLFGDSAGAVSICPISTDPADGGILVGYYDPIQGYLCANFLLGTSPYITTSVSSMVFGSFVSSS